MSAALVQARKVFQQRCAKLEEDLSAIDAANLKDIYYVSEFGQRIEENMRKAEDQTLADPFYMKNLQTMISEQERAQLVNRCFQIARHFQLRDETVFLTVNMADRYLSHVTVESKLEMALVFCAALLIATKYEEIYPPTGKELL